jgi:hypothetical protein
MATVVIAETLAELQQRTQLKSQNTYAKGVQQFLIFFRLTNALVPHDWDTEKRISYGFCLANLIQTAIL